MYYLLSTGEKKSGGVDGRVCRAACTFTRAARGCMRHTAMPRTGGHQDGHAMASVTEGLKREQVPFMARVYCFWKGRWMPVLLCCVGEARSSLVLAACMLCKQRVCLVWVLKFNKHCSTFVLFDRKFLILD
jgi:hypothetical protein